ncbi:hypothetical protein TNCV_4660651 [Trichonephila clavipes]|uniref:Uncharacterized protein n=1 Tax=Trichonephila clavipes TaxID=2585209 RepID=A0A8X6V8I3_TRICX|nr:hypothetical protein TNCV_4660651 [Trichonephila clavipes]
MASLELMHVMCNCKEECPRAFRWSTLLWIKPSIVEYESRLGTQEGLEQYKLHRPDDIMTQTAGLSLNPGEAVVTRGHGTTPLRVKEDIEDVPSELGNGD